MSIAGLRLLQMHWESVSVAFAGIFTHAVKLRGQIDIFGKLNFHKVVEARLALFIGIEL